MSEAPAPTDREIRRIAGEILPDDLAALAAGPIGEALRDAMRLASTTLAPRTEQAYADAWAHFCAWCEEGRVVHLPALPAVAGAYLAARSKTVGKSGLRVSLAAMAYYHRRSGYAWSSAHPIIASVLKGILRQQKKPVRPAAALTSTEIKAMLSELGDDLHAVRDRALLLVGFAGGLRRSEIVALDVEDIRFNRDGMVLRIRSSKADQEGEGADVGIARGSRPETCPIKATQAWLRAGRIEYGAVFRGVSRGGRLESRLKPQAVWDIVKRRAGAAEIPIPEGERLSAHGLRAGFISEAYLHGALDEQVMAHARQRSTETTRGYRQRAKVVQASPTKLLDL